MYIMIFSTPQQSIRYITYHHINVVFRCVKEGDIQSQGQWCAKDLWYHMEFWDNNEIRNRVNIQPLSFSTHLGRVTHICVGNLTIIGSDNGLSPGRRQAITWTNAGLLSITPWGTHFNEILIGIQAFSFKKTHLKMSSVKWRRGLNELMLFSDVLKRVTFNFRGNGVRRICGITWSSQTTTS